MVDSIRILTPDSIRYWIQMQTADSQVPNHVYCSVFNLNNFTACLTCLQKKLDILPFYPKIADDLHMLVFIMIFIGDSELGTTVFDCFTRCEQRICTTVL